MFGVSAHPRSPICLSGSGDGEQSCGRGSLLTAVSWVCPGQGVAVGSGPGDWKNRALRVHSPLPPMCGHGCFLSGFYRVRLL